MQHLNIAIDGPAGAGKSTVAKKIAVRMGLIYIDTGAMYRALTWKALRQGISLDDDKKLTLLAYNTEIELSPTPDGPARVTCDGRDITEEIRTPEISGAVSKLAKHPGVRTRMVELQRQMAAQRGVVMDGRDIGTFVLPNADFKFFLTASLDERAERRCRELKQLGHEVDLAELKAQIAERDKLDESRETAPLAAAPDAILLDTEKLDIEQVVDRMFSICCKEG